jgi:hypothetical protein
VGAVVNAAAVPIEENDEIVEKEGEIAVVIVEIDIVIEMIAATGIGIEIETGMIAIVTETIVETRIESEVRQKRMILKTSWHESFNHHEKRQLPSVEIMALVLRRIKVRYR